MIKRSYWWIVILLHLGFVSQAQQVKDKNLPDTAAVNTLTRAGKLLMYEYPDSALHYFKEAIRLSEDPRMINENAENYNLAGVAHYVMGEYDQALPLFTKSLRMFEETENHYGLSSNYNSIGLIYQTQGRYEKAIEYHKKGVAQARIITNKDRMSLNNFNIGLAYDELGHYDSALYFVKLAYGQSSEVGFQRVILMSLNRMGMIFFHLKNYAEAETYFNKALHYKHYKTNWEDCLALIGLARIREAEGNYEAGIILALQSLSVAKKMGAKWDIIEAAETLSRLYARKNSYKEAYDISLMLQVYKDSVFNEAKEQQINYLHLNENELEKSRLEKQNLIQAGKLKQSRLQFVMAFIAAGSLLIIMMVLYSRHQQKLKLNLQLIATNQTIERQNKDLNEANQTKAKLFSIISHDMRGPFASLQGVLELLSSADVDEIQKQELFMRLAETYKNVSSTLDNLLQWSQSQMNGLVAHPKVVVVDELISKSLLFWKSSIAKKSIKIQYTPQQHKVYADMYQFKIVIRNIIGNAIKFTPASGTICIDTFEEKEKMVVSIKDSGIGIPPQIKENLFKFGKENHRPGTEQESGTGLGLMICYQLMEKNGGYIEVESEEQQGSTFLLHIPHR